MPYRSHAIIEVAYSEEEKRWGIGVFWPGEQSRTRETYGPFSGFIQARERADGIALKLTEEGEPAPQIIVLAGALWGKVTTF